MARRKSHAQLKVLINSRLAGRLNKEASGAVNFQYDAAWLEWPNAFAISLSLPMRETAYSGESVVAVFDNLLPDNPAVRKRVAERMGAQGTDYHSLLEAIGRDCVGAMQFLPEGKGETSEHHVTGEPISEDEIERTLAALEVAPLGVDKEQEFRISIAGAQAKTALLWHNEQWMRPIGTTPTTHLLKPQLDEIPTAFGAIDMADSVDNEHYCLKLMEAFGLDVAKTEIATFGQRRVLVVERFDRRWRNRDHILRLPQEDCCQALGLSSAQKYQSHHGPSAVDILTLLQRSDEPLKDQAAFFKSQILFWLVGATDGHGKNFSVFLKPEGRYGLTPFYDVLSAQSAFDKKQIPHNKYKLAMSAGKSRHYRIRDIVGRHFVETGKEAGLGSTIIRAAIEEVIETAAKAPELALTKMPSDFATGIHESIVGAIPARLRLLISGLEYI